MVIAPPTPTPKKTGGYLGTPFRSFKPIVSNKIYIWVCEVRTKDTMYYTSITADTPASNPSLVSCRCCSKPIHTVAILWIAVRLTPYPSRNEEEGGLLKSSEQTNQIHSQSFFTFIAWSHYFLDRSGTDNYLQKDTCQYKLEQTSLPVPSHPLNMNWVKQYTNILFTAAVVSLALISLKYTESQNSKPIFKPRQPATGAPSGFLVLQESTSIAHFIPHSFKQQGCVPYMQRSVSLHQATSLLAPSTL